MSTMPLIEATEEMVAELHQSLAGEAKFDWLTRQIYSTDASMYRVIPAGVVFPKDGDDVAAAVEIAAKYDIPVIPRGGGTSLSGQTVGNGLVLDYSRHVNRLLELNPDEQWVHVQAGANLEWLNARLRAHNLIVGPDPSSAKGNTLGGMTGNNSTGTHSIVYGMMSDQVYELEVVLANQRWFKGHQATNQDKKGAKGKVILWDDTYLSYNEPTIGQATVKVLEAAGFEVMILHERRCCGRPMISKGLLKEARANAAHNIALLAPYAAQGIPIIGVEPSCITTFRDEYSDLVPAETEDKDENGQQAARLVAENSFFIEEFLANLAQQGQLALPFAKNHAPRHILVHGHCYQKATIGTAPLLSLLRLIPNTTVEEIPSGCCGMAGSFGYEKEHFDISIACGEDRLFPTVRQAHPNTP